MSCYLVYKAVSPSGKCYIGITSKTLHKRKWQHINKAFKAGLKTPFHKAIRKYNGNLEWIVVFENLTKSEACEKEVELIEQYKKISGVYNVNLGGNLPWNTGKSCPIKPETVAKIIKSRKGYKHSEQTKKKISQSNLGKTHSLDRVIKSNLKKKIKPLEVYTIDNKYIKSYLNYSQCARDLNIHTSGIRKVLAGEISNCKSFKFKLQGEDFPNFIDKRTLRTNDSRLKAARALFNATILLTINNETKFTFLSRVEFIEQFNLTPKMANNCIKSGSYKEYTVTKVINQPA